MCPPTDGSTEGPGRGRASERGFEPFDLPSWHGEKASDLTFQDGWSEPLLERLVDPASATETIHWGRNYLFRTRLVTTDGELDVVVKQFRNVGPRKKLDRKLRGSKAERSWKMARAFVDADIPTARPLIWIESKKADGPSYFITEFLGDMVEARYVLRAVHEEALDERFPDFELETFLRSLGTALRKMHEAGLFHRDLSIGNVLFAAGATAPGPDDLWIIDLNRGRKKTRLGLLTRTRDLCRLTIYRPEHQRLFLDAYWSKDGGSAGLSPRLAFKLYHYGFRAKIAGKRFLRAPFRGLLEAMRPRRAHVHIPDAPEGASSRDKIVWDYLSDQPHQHASKLDKLKVRIVDAPSHVKNIAVCIAAAPRVYRRYRHLKKELYRRPVPWQGVGVCIRPFPEAPDALRRAVDDLGVRNILLRLHPWQESHEAEEELARDLHRDGYDLAFALPQDRDLVRDPRLWRRRIEDLAERFVPYGKSFQVGQAINRSKWGIWRYGEYFELARIADDVLRRYPQVEIFGPAVIDFELYSTASVVGSKACPPLDGLSSLLYVDRRGAPENRQMGFDTVDKVLLCQAIAEASRRCGDRSWITEVNWPLWEGPHSPAGKSVSVSEADQAKFLTRYYVLALTTGAAERVYWWQMIARGYGLIAPQDPEGDADGLRRREAFDALKTLNAELSGFVFKRRLPSPDGAYLFEFEKADEKTVVGWSLGVPIDVTLPYPVRKAVGLTGRIVENVGQGVQGPGVRLVDRAQFFRI